MTEYMPTPDEAFDATLYTWLDWKSTFENESDARAAWDRMIAEVERAAAEKAWDEAMSEFEWYFESPPANPYRAEAYRREETE